MGCTRWMGRLFGAWAGLLAVSVPALAQSKPTTYWRPAAPDNYTSVSYNRGIQYVVLHTIEGSAQGAISWFQNSRSNVSAHYVVSYTGTLYQCVRDKDIAWHAGNWYYNTHSIGIEHEGYAFRNYWTDREYRASAALTRWICLTYGIPMDRAHIIGHNEVPGATHRDPGPYFNWNYYMSLVRSGSSSSTTSILQAMQSTADTLNVRSGPSTGYSILGTIARGQQYVAVAASGGWYKIHYADNTGWCYGGYLTRVAGVTGVAIQADILNVRAGPSTGYRIVGTASKGRRYVRIAVSGSWYKIWWGGGAWWVHGGYTSTFGL